VPSLADIEKFFEWFAKLPPVWQLGVVLLFVVVFPSASFFYVQRLRNRLTTLANVIETRDGVISLKEQELHAKDAMLTQKEEIKNTIIIQKDSMIQALQVQLQIKEQETAKSIQQIERGEAYPEVFARLTAEFVKASRPNLVLEWKAAHLITSHGNPAHIRVQCYIEIRNDGAATALHGWQIRVRLPTRDIDINDADFLIDQKLIELGGIRKGSLIFDVGDDHEKDGHKLDILQITVRVCDFTGKLYEVSGLLEDPWPLCKRMCRDREVDLKSEPRE
jgi:hypothetical protein